MAATVILVVAFGIVVPTFWQGGVFTNGILAVSECSCGEDTQILTATI